MTTEYRRGSTAKHFQSRRSSETIGAAWKEIESMKLMTETENEGEIVSERYSARPAAMLRTLSVEVGNEKR